MPSTATNRLQGLTTSVAVKPPCITVALSSITLAGLQTISGVTVTEGDRVLVTAQASGIDNGIYLASTGSWTRALDFDGELDAVSGTRVLVRSPSSSIAAEYELTTADPIVIGTTALTFTLRYGANATYGQTEDEIAAVVTPVNYEIPSHDICGLVYVERYGDAGNTTALANAILVAKQADRKLWINPATYTSASTLLTINQDAMKVHMERGVLFSYTGAGAAILFSGVSNAVITGEGQVTCTNAAAICVDLEATAGAHCLFNTATFHALQGSGRGALPGTNTNIGLKFGQIVGGKIVYWNKVTARRIIDVNTGVLFDAPTGSAGDGANANTVYDAMLDNYWYGAKYLAIENFTVNVQGYGSPGSGSDITYLHYIDNASFYNQINGGGGEPGALSSPYYIVAGCNYNSIDIQASNFGLAGTDLGDGNIINVGRDLYRIQISTGDALTENTNYRLSKLTVQNTNSGTATLKWRARNTVNGYYSSGSATIYAWAQGGATVQRIDAQFQESDQTVASQTRFIGVIVSGFDIYPIFSVRNFGGANATTGIDITLDCLGIEPHRSGPTVEAGTLSARAATTISINQSVADDGTVLLPNGVEGFGTVSAGAETMLFNVLSTGAVVKVAGSTNTVATDTDANLCVFDGGTYATIRNRLGSTQIVKGSFTF